MQLINLVCYHLSLNEYTRQLNIHKKCQEGNFKKLSKEFITEQFYYFYYLSHSEIMIITNVHHLEIETRLW